ncbi:uncharacterized protein TM35_000032950 [Trypanosoma theileri]|uniref:Uncharacterized protein n=1 Tax=Trypanosoma theileri TaxID=67003 RepID=A0A1X0P6I1_9TRYP|nr:uncharacterized protein TM35_000032950 [Trypanosoma theileri]ORC92542.1 hypothetical protein TM35_000032950 [Trypanosoma theileri]
MSPFNQNSTARSADKMNGIGMPILFILVLFSTIFATRNMLKKAVVSSFQDTMKLLTFVTALASITLSISLYFSTAFNYGLVTTVLGFSMIFLNSSLRIKQFMTPLLIVYLAWFLVLVGIPSYLNQGIITATNSINCLTFYGSFASTMCNDGWLTFVKIIASVIVSVTLLSVLLLASEVFGSAQSVYLQTEVQETTYQDIAKPLVHQAHQ